MTRPKKPEGFRNLTTKEILSTTPRDVKLHMPHPDTMIELLDKAANFSKIEGPEFVALLKSWWRYTTQYKERAKYLQAWLNNPRFMVEYAQWRLAAIEAKTARYYAFGEKPGDPTPVEDKPYEDMEDDC